MATALRFKIKQSETQLRKLLNNQPEHLRNRVRMLLVCKKSKRVLSKHSLAEIIGVNHNSIQSWRRMYVKGGIDKLLEFNKGGYKPSLINAAAHKAIEKKLNNPNNAFRSYQELRRWIDERFVRGINYHTVNKYIKRKFTHGLGGKFHANVPLAKANKPKRTLKKISAQKK
jgi:transposase